MGSFEKLGILVIVVIIVMILAVAIYQWGATGADHGPTVLPNLARNPETLIVDYDDDPATTPPEANQRKPAKTPPPAAGEWAGGIPKTYTIQSHDIVWKLVVNRWHLKEGFISRIKKANPRLNMKRLRPGDRLTIPDPEQYRTGGKRTAPARRGTRRYEIKEGDLLETIARDHLGDKSRWKEIVALNPGLNPKNMKLGTSILVPVK